MTEEFEVYPRDGRPLEMEVGKEYLRGDRRWRVVETVETSLTPGLVRVRAELVSDAEAAMVDSVKIS